VKIDKVRIVGFKSFADPVEFSVLPGITGIVGPNGCGKSNLIEALRWAMGETSAKRMRADGMDDVIFGGTETRPPRASCEVAVTIENSERRAPAEFNSSDTIVAARRLDRGDGSSYRVNGNPARARDVQTLFQDAGVGAGSAALVSQGKVASIIQSKPSERRSILEEAAGISGLASRKRDAEIKLKATEQNLEKAATLERGLGEQLVSLRKQARQAARRRALDDLIRASEAASFLVRWNTAITKKAEIETAHNENEAKVVNAILALQAAEAALAAVEIEVAPAMQVRADAETAVAIARAAFDAAEKDIPNSRSAAAAAARAVERAASDVEHDQAALIELQESIDDLLDRKAIAEDGIEQDGEKIEEAKCRVEALEAELGGLTGKIETLAASLASAEAMAKALEDNKRNLISRQHEIDARIASILERVKQDEARLSELKTYTDDLETAESSLENIDQMLASIVDERDAAADLENTAKQRVNEIESKLRAVRTEANALRSLAAREGQLTLHLKANDGMEAALAAALGEAITAGLNEKDGKWWEASGLRVEPPLGTAPLADVVSVPEEMVAAISGIGVVTTPPSAATISALQIGQSIVSTTGILWRWDGYRTSETGIAAATLQRAAQLQTLIAEEDRLSVMFADFQNDLIQKAERLNALKLKESEVRTEVKIASLKVESARREREKVTNERNSVSASLLASETILSSARAEMESTQAQIESCNRDVARLPTTTTMTSELNTLRSASTERRNALSASRSEYEKARREADQRVLTIASVMKAIDEAQRKQAATLTRHAELNSRLAEARAEHERLQAKASAAPQVAADAKERFQETADNLAAVITRVSEGEAKLSGHRTKARQEADILAGLREINAGLIVEMKASHAAENELRREISERLSCEPEFLRQISGIAEDQELPDVAACDARAARLIREREALGVVNLLAEKQVEEMEGRVTEAKKAMDELRETVARLRRSIADFDREARSRLMEAFVAIDGHFKDLFTRLFGGGHAHLKLSGSDDPLEAGLEVYACPPGKKLQSMSLLSGGEQALTALALVFAIFMVNPAPVCVLDEVDAPLDDANINRLCDLVMELAANDATRFLIVTHHTLTMSKSDRLYGVTMGERGVSKLAALNLEAAAAFVGERAQSA